MFKKIIAFVIFTCLIVSSMTIFTNSVETSERFDDVDSDSWYYYDVYYCKYNSIMEGVSKTSFGPSDNLSRAMAVTVLYRMDGEPETTDAPGFEDVASGKWFTLPISWAKASGIVNGKSESAFSPDENVSRAEFATILYRYSIYANIDIPAESDAIPTDEDAIPDYAKAAVSAMYGAGVINGRNGGVFDPDSSITRAEASAMIHRFKRLATGSQSGNASDSSILPRLSYLFEVSENVVKGQVTGIVYEGHTNPSGTEVNKSGDVIPYGQRISYSFRVDEVYFGSVEPGDIIQIDCTYSTGLPADYDPENGEIINSDDINHFSLDIGAAGIFFLDADNIYTSESSDTSYYIVCESWGVFDRTDSDGNYKSSVFTMSTSELLEQVKKMQQKETFTVGEPSYIAPDLSHMFDASDVVVEGEITGKIYEGNSNYSGTALNRNGDVIPYGTLLVYTFRVDKVYGGNVCPGDILEIDCIIPTGLSSEDMYKYDLEMEYSPLKFTAGQSGILFLYKDNVYTSADSTDIRYCVTCEDWGFFDRINSEGNYCSTMFELAPSLLNEK